MHKQKGKSAHNRLDASASDLPVGSSFQCFKVSFIALGLCAVTGQSLGNGKKCQLQERRMHVPGTDRCSLLAGRV
ncbi:hypothetical protein BaRGS_00033987 [Batillaria attramentaria]|uniref:Uncharacterized protein n=1 Tax=Batillaria attramentaria TaxID=370345 RepID=A0ABD0JII4_9CAEN